MKKNKRNKRLKRKSNLYVFNNIFTIFLLILVCSCIKHNYTKGIKQNKYLLQNINKSITENVPSLSSIKVVNSNIDIKEYECCFESKLEATKEVIPIYDNDTQKDTMFREFSENDKYLLAKIAMAEAEGQNMQTKTLVIMSVLNRVESKDFPDSISEVIFQNNGNTYQYSPVMQGGRWWTTEPNAGCYEAVEVVLSTEHDYSGGALYFESCEEEENWHSRNLTYLYQSEDLRFYK